MNKFQKVIIYSMAGLFLTSLLSFTLQTSEGRLEFEDTVQKFKPIDQGEKLTFDFPFKNVGTAPVVITDVKVTCGCSVPNWPKEPIKPGEKNKITVVFNSEGKWGWQEKQVKVVTNGAGNGTVLTFKGKVIKPKED